MPNIWYDADADAAHIAKRKVAVIGYGSQGHAHALNLKESGVDVIVGLYEGSSSKANAEAEGLEVLETGAAAAAADVIVFAIPDTSQRRVYEESVRDNLTPGNTLVFIHGFNIHFGEIVPPEDVNVVMVAPKGPGHLVRRTYTEGGGVPALVAVHQDATGDALEIAKSYAKAIGSTRAGLLETTFGEETETDLFGEQAVLCGGAAELIRAGFETLVNAGYQPEVAYFECLHELKLIVDLCYEGGLSWMRYSISETAEYGDYTRGPRVVNDSTREEMKKILGEIQDGTFAKQWIQENNEGAENFKAMRAAARDSAVEAVGKKLRSMMPFLNAKEVPEGRG